MSDNWKWRIGFIHGYGECLWQEADGQIRRITKPVSLPDGQLLLIKSIACLAAKDAEPVWNATRMVVDGRDCRDDLAADAERAWGGGVIQPANGPLRFKTR